MTAALLDIIAEHRPRFPTIEDISKRAGKDPQAVGELFGSVQDILDTLAEQGLIKLYDRCLRTVTKAPADNPVAQFRAVGTAYLNWACENPAHFRLLQLSKLVDIDGNKKLARYVGALHDLMLKLLAHAKRNNQIPPDADDLAILIAGRCMLFGLARMAIDRDMSRWYEGQSPREAAQHAFDNYVKTMAIAYRGDKRSAQSR